MDIAQERQRPSLFEGDPLSLFFGGEENRRTDDLLFEPELTPFDNLHENSGLLGQVEFDKPEEILDIRQK